MTSGYNYHFITGWRPNCSISLEGGTVIHFSPICADSYTHYYCSCLRYSLEFLKLHAWVVYLCTNPGCINCPMRCAGNSNSILIKMGKGVRYPLRILAAKNANAYAGMPHIRFTIFSSTTQFMLLCIWQESVIDLLWFSE